VKTSPLLAYPPVPNQAAEVSVDHRKRQARLPGDILGGEILQFLAGRYHRLRGVVIALMRRAAGGLIRNGVALVGLRGTAASMGRSARKKVGAAVRGWASCLGRIFEIHVIKCRCGGRMVPMGTIRDDAELDRVLRHEGLEVDFPRTKPSRAPPSLYGGEEGQMDPSSEAWDGKDEERADD